MAILIQFIIGLGLLVVVLGVFLLLVWVGFRMGRRTVDKPMAPIVQPKTKMLVEEDPYWEPMHGAPQPHAPTVREETEGG